MGESSKYHRRLIVQENRQDPARTEPRRVQALERRGPRGHASGREGRTKGVHLVAWEGLPVWASLGFEALERRSRGRRGGVRGRWRRRGRGRGNGASAGDVAETSVNQGGKWVEAEDAGLEDDDGDDVAGARGSGTIGEEDDSAFGTWRANAKRKRARSRRKRERREQFPEPTPRLAGSVYGHVGTGRWPRSGQKGPEKSAGLRATVERGADKVCGSRGAKGKGGLRLRNWKCRAREHDHVRGRIAPTAKGRISRGFMRRPDIIHGAG
ncbi:hypothetical protein HO133_006537 [Letharia lupina]|uniref:Uncharacterized protein n=1 Tax=Letharia lupina TaxID=560253 RepID=A0A8H6C5T0_9LECA|nr:uncharacterized protein HO133_006537 [Letharia lupina]KAF6217710.1 hypothetical protein HO133_006537 [Letharia lupina]